jgi:Predicted membrane GTPase involved in stress response
MRREGYELQIGQPTVITKEIDGVKCEPIEDLIIDLPEVNSGTAVEMATLRKGEMTNMTPKGDRMIVTFKIPSRGIIGMPLCLAHRNGRRSNHEPPIHWI